jgi:hypothetical protein
MDIRCPPHTLQISRTAFCSSRGIGGGEFFRLLFRSERNLTPIIRHQLSHTPKGIRSLLFFKECRNQKNTTWVTCTCKCTQVTFILASNIES